MQFYLVSDYMNEARVLLQDQVAPYRYADDQLLTAINTAFLEIARVRPDILASMKYHVPLACQQSIDDILPPVFNANNVNQPVFIPPQYKPAVVFYMAHNNTLIDVEDVEDKRSDMFLQMFRAEMGID